MIPLSLLHGIAQAEHNNFDTLKGGTLVMAKKTNDRSRKPDNTEKIPLPFDADKIGRNVSKDRV